LEKSCSFSTTKASVKVIENDVFNEVFEWLKTPTTTNKKNEKLLNVSSKQ
jgi:hypothetical protein